MSVKQSDTKVMYYCGYKIINIMSKAATKTLLC